MPQVREGALIFDAGIDNAALNRQVEETKRRISGLATSTEKETGRMDTAFRNLARGVGAYFSFQALRGFTRELIQVRGEFEQLDVALQTILKSKARADALFGEIIEFALKTPFQLTDISKATKQLIAYGFEADNVVETLRVLGDVASGVSQPIGDLVYLYGTLRTQGRAYTRDILQFTSRGIPIIKGLADQLGVAESQVQKLVEAGRIGFPVVEAAFREMTKEGGIFANLMERQSQTIIGQLSNLRDAWDKMLNDIGQSTQGVFSGAISAARALIENYEEIGKGILVIISTYGAYKAAVVALTLAKRYEAFINTKAIALQKLEILQGRALTLEQSRRIVTSRLLTASNLRLMASQIKLNAVMLANPYVLATTAIVGLGAALIAYTKRTTDAEKAQERFNERVEERSKQLEDEVRQINNYVQTLKDETETLFRKQIAYERLIRVMPEVFKNYSKEELMLKSLAELQELVNQGRDVKEIDQAKADYQDLIDQIDRVSERIEFFANNRTIDVDVRNQTIEGLKDQIEALQIELQLAQKEVEKLSKAEFDAKPVEDRLAHYENIRTSLQQQLDELIKIRDESSEIGLLWGGFENFIDRIRFDALKQELEKVNAVIQEITPKSSATVAQEIKKLKRQLEEEKETLRQLQAPTSLFDPAAIEETEARIKSITDQLKQLGVEGKKSAPFGSLKYWEDVAKKAEEIISLTPRENESEIRKQQQIKTDAEEKAEEIRQLIAKRSFDEELEYKRKQYELYQRWIQFTNKEAADEQFKTLIAEGQGYVDFLQRRVDQLQSKINSGSASRNEIEQFQALNTELQDATGAQSKIDLFRDKLEQAKDEAISLTEYLKRLRQEQDKLAGDRTDFGFSARKEIAEEIQKAEQERAKLLQQFEQDTQTTEQRETAIVKNFNDLRAEANRQYLQGRLKDRLAIMEKIEQAEKEALATERARVAQSSDFYQKLFGDIVNYGVRSLRELADQTQAVLDSARKTDSADGREYFLVDIPALDEEGNQIKKQVKLTLEEFIRFQNQIIAIQGEIRTKNPFVAIGESWKELKKAFDAEGDNSDAVTTAISEFNASIQEATGMLSEWGRTLSSVLGEDLARSVDTLGQLAEGLAEVGTGIAAKDPVAIVDGVVKIIGALGDVINKGKQIAEENRKIQQDINRLQREFNLLLNERIRLQEAANDNVFIDNWVNSLQQAIDASEKANQAFQNLLQVTDLQSPRGVRTIAGDLGFGKIRDATIEEFLKTLQVQTGTKKGGFLGLGKADAVFSSLLETFPELIEDGEFMVDVAEKIVAEMGDKLPRATKDALEQLIAWSDAAEDAKEQMEGVISTLAGNLGNDIRDALVSAFQDGTDAAVAFGDSVESVLENILSQQIFNAVFAPALKNLEKQMLQSFGPGGDQTFVDELGNFFSKAPELIKAFNQGLQDAQDEAKGFGFDLFESTTDDVNQGLSGAIKGVSEETAGIIAGQMNAIRINQVENGSLLRQSLIHQAEIAANTRYNKHLESIDRKLNALENNSLRGGGLE